LLPHFVKIEKESPKRIWSLPKHYTIGICLFQEKNSKKRKIREAILVFFFFSLCPQFLIFKKDPQANRAFAILIMFSD